MDTVKFLKGNTKAVAHRGLSGIETENTNAAFIAAGSRSYYGIETDVHRTADGKIVVVHDENLKRVAGEDVDVETSTLAQLQSIILFDKDGSKGRADLRVPTLENYISICKKYGKHCVLELKSDFTPEEIAYIIDSIKSLAYLENVTFISFGYQNLLEVRKLAPDQPAQFLFEEFTPDILEQVTADKLDVDIYFKALDEQRVRDLHSRGIKVNCWTVDDKETAERLARWGVDYITSNILE